MNKILKLEKAIRIANELHGQAKSIVLAGGCFDILHIGHITFLEKAKAQGDVLFVFLEADARIKELKGVNRPINNQADRAIILGAIQAVDYVILLTPNLKDRDYTDMITKIKPAVIAVTQGDLHKKHKKMQADSIGCQVIEVTEVIKDQSTSRLVKLLGDSL